MVVAHRRRTLWPRLYSGCARSPSTAAGWMSGGWLILLQGIQLRFLTVDRRYHAKAARSTAETCRRLPSSSGQYQNLRLFLRQGQAPENQGCCRSRSVKRSVRQELDGCTGTPHPPGHRHPHGMELSHSSRTPSAGARCAQQPQPQVQKAIISSKQACMVDQTG